MASSLQIRVYLRNHQKKGMQSMPRKLRFRFIRLWPKY